MAHSKQETEPPSALVERLDSWKEIAAYLKRSVRSVQRWEAEEGMPVHRHLHDKRGTIYGFKSELDAWWKERGEILADRNGEEEPVVLPPAPEALALASADAAVVPRQSYWKRARTGTVFALSILVVGLVAWLARSGGRSGSPRPLPFQVRDWVLVTSFENRTGEALLDGTLEYAFTRALANSRYVNVVPRERVGDALRLMRKPLETRVDAGIGREICLRDGGIRALITGRIERFGPKYLLSVEVLDPHQGASIQSIAEEAVRDEDLLRATRRISDRVRTFLGETRPSTRQDERTLLKVTTPSLRALQIYSRADFLIAAGNSAAAEELLKQALAEDPDFASAYILLAHAIHNQKRPVAEFRPYAERAFRISESTTDRERYFIRGSYYDLLGQTEKAIAAYEALLSLYPDDFWSTQNLIGGYFSKGRFGDAVELEVRRADLRPWDFTANFAAAFDLAPLDRGRSRRYVDRARELISPTVVRDRPADAAWLELVPAAEAWLDGNLTRSLHVTNGLAAKIDSLTGLARAGFALETCGCYVTLGRLEAATRCIEKIGDPLLRHKELSRVAFMRDDPVAVKEHLQALEGADGEGQLSPGNVILMARAGLLPQAALLLAKIESKQSILVPGYLRIPRGELALARGELGKGIAELEEGTERVGDLGYWVFFLGSETLAKAWKQRGNVARAVEVLERASGKRSSAAFERAGALWLRNQSQLARLYREIGRTKDARRIEKELRELLSLADSDHPILQELQRLQES